MCLIFFNHQGKSMKHFFKSGASSILLGYGYYGKHLPVRENTLVKVTNVTDKHNEFKTLPYIRRIQNYTKYYCIPDDLSFKIGPGDPFYEYVKNLCINDKDISLFNKNNNLQYNFIENAGNFELLDTINELFDRDFSFWCCYNDILDFTKQILYGIYYLHKNKICHLDLKPENIIVNKVMFTFKLIDFGFSSIEPFDDFVENIKGTPGYFPSHNNKYIISEFFPRIYANDIIYNNGDIPIVKNRKLIYRIDSYCFGRILFCLTKTFQTYKPSECCLFWNRSENKKEKKLFKICKILLENDVNKRATIEECIKTHFHSCDLISII